MIFSHRDDPARTATLTCSGRSPAAFEVQHTDASGKARKKSFSNAEESKAHDAALRFLLNKEGYVLRAPQEGPIRWMARLLQDYRGELGHAVDRDTGVVWVLDAMDQVHRITPGTCETKVVALKSGGTSPGGMVAIGASGMAWCVAPTWVRAGEELVRRYTLYRLTDEVVATQVADVQGKTVMGSLSSTRGGLVLGPADGGAALHDPQGQIVRQFPCVAGEGTPVGAISANGEWVVLSEIDRVRRIHVATAEEAVFGSDFTKLGAVQVTDDGAVYVSGFRYPSWGVYRVDVEVWRVSDDFRAAVSADGATLVEAQHGGVVVRDPRVVGDDGFGRLLARAHLPVLGMAKYGRAAFGPGTEISVLTDAYTLASIDTARLG